ncbi:hypothetical protein DUI87_09123 [Hirundo rustica rustica]|uniref:Uncharacterized protein n=1 Tax=Hirundo rustica rustica TaxID=333673 RepID=A0A3M0KLS4_HIRRU|nr:hypothetical protein DUI87_09123 [Hirundo rustica rustica]
MPECGGPSQLVQTLHIEEEWFCPTKATKTVNIPDSRGEDEVPSANSNWNYRKYSGYTIFHGTKDMPTYMYTKTSSKIIAFAPVGYMTLTFPIPVVDLAQLDKIHEDQGDITKDWKKTSITPIHEEIIGPSVK